MGQKGKKMTLKVTDGNHCGVGCLKEAKNGLEGGGTFRKFGYLLKETRFFLPFHY